MISNYKLLNNDWTQNQRKVIHVIKYDRSIRTVASYFAYDGLAELIKLST